MIENVSTQLTVFHCLCPLPVSRKGLRLPLRSALFGEGGRDWRPCILWVYVWVSLQSVIMVFAGHTHLLFNMLGPLPVTKILHGRIQREREDEEVRTPPPPPPTINRKNSVS